VTAKYADPVYSQHRQVRAARCPRRRREGCVGRHDPGLQIRTWQDGTCKWSVRTRLYDKQRRYDLGQVCEGDRDKVPAICLKTARSRAFKVKEMCGAGLRPDRQLEAWASGTTIERLERDAPPSWEWDHAKKQFFAWLKAKRRPTTLRTTGPSCGTLFSRTCPAVPSRA